VEEDLERLEVQEWREKVQDRKKWRYCDGGQNSSIVLNARGRRRRYSMRWRAVQ